MKARNHNMLEGSLWDKILFFSLPLAASSILQQLFNACDSAVVGRFAGSEALAAVGANTPVTSLFINALVGLSIGAMFVRSLTIMLVEKKTLKQYVYLEHGAHWAIGALALIMFISSKLKANF